MRNQILTILCILLLLGGCKKKKEGIEALPEATQIGKNTFGCLVNGEVYVPKSSGFESPDGTSYQFSNGKFFFVLSNKRAVGNVKESFLIRSNDIELEEKTYILMQYNYDRSFSVKYSFSTGNESDDYETSPSLKGELRITKLDQVKRIIAGTFSFDAENKNGQKVEIREGRFDSTY